MESPPRSPAQSRYRGKPEVDEVFDQSNLSDAHPQHREGDRPVHGKKFHLKYHFLSH